jgi:hypothetical protein
VARCLVTVHHIKTKEQPADVLTKPLGDEDSMRHCLTLAVGVVVLSQLKLNQGVMGY